MSYFEIEQQWASKVSSARNGYDGSWPKWFKGQYTITTKLQQKTIINRWHIMKIYSFTGSQHVAHSDQGFKIMAFYQLPHGSDLLQRELNRVQFHFKVPSIFKFLLILFIYLFSTTPLHSANRKGNYTYEWRSCRGIIIYHKIIKNSNSNFNFNHSDHFL